jgi:hypothetical protein
MIETETPPMKIPTEVLEVWLGIMSDEDLLRFRKRLTMDLASKTWKKEKREALIDLFTAEIKRRKENPEAE